MIMLLIAAFIAFPCAALADEAGDAPAQDTPDVAVVEADDQDAENDGSSDAQSDATESEPSAPVSDEPANEIVTQDEVAPVEQPAEAVEPAEDPAPADEGAADAADDAVATDEEPVTEPEATAPAAATEEAQPVSAAAETTAAAGAATTVAKKTTQAKAKKSSPKQPIANGWYYIQSTKLLSVLLTSISGGKNAVVKADKAAKRQRWYVKFNTKKQAYSLYNASSGKYLAIKSTKKGANVYLIDSGKKKKSLWYIAENSAGGYTLKAYSAKYLLDINGGKKIKSGANVDIAKKKSKNGKVKAYQRWYFIPMDVDYSDSTKSLANGYYTISLNKANTMSVTVPGSSKADGAGLTSNKYEGELNQKYVVQKQSDGTYTLRNIASAKYLTVDGSKVVQNPASGDDSQKWRAVDLGNGSVTFVNVATGKALAVKSGSTAEDAEIVAANPKSTPGQRFTVKRRNILDNGYYYLHMASGSDKANVATVNDGSKKNGAKVTAQKRTNYNDYGTFKVKHLGGGVYQFTNLESGKVLIASGSSVVQGAEGGDNGKWKALMNPNGGVTLTNIDTGNVMTSDTAADSKVKALAENGNVNQSWHVQKALVLKPYQKRELEKILERGSKKNYYFFVDISVARMTIWTRASKKAEWTIMKDYLISYGRIENGKTKTPLMDDKIHTHRRWLDSEGAYGGYWSAPYAVRWSPTAWFHSFTHYWKHSPRVIDKRLGMAVSGGCIRMQDQYSKWIYDHHSIIKGAAVTVWNAGKYHL